MKRSAPPSGAPSATGVDDLTRRRDALVARFALVLFVSGFCSLVYQVAWFRLARQVFGASTASTSAVVAIFMGGLGLGAALLGRRTARAASPLRLYANLETGIAVTAALTPLTMGLVQWLYIALGGAHALGEIGALTLRLVLATVVLGIPTTLMGGTLPVMAHALEVDRDRGRRLVALLYGINTLGAVTGALLANFAAIELLGIRKTIWVAALINLLLPLVVRALARHAEAIDDDRGRTPPQADQPTAVAGRRPALPIPVILALAALVGFVFFLMELVWYRLLGPLLGGTSYTFGLILAMALVGIGTGSVAYSFGRRDRRPSVLALAFSLALEGLFMIVPFALGDHLAYFAAIVRNLSATGFPGLVLSWAIVAAVVVVPAAAVAGYQFPLLVGLIGAGADRVGQHVGRVYAWNTWGSILGSLAGGFGLMPLLGAVTLWWSSAALLALAGLALAIVALVDRRWTALLVGAMGVVTLVLCTAEGPTAFWRQTSIGAGRLAGFSGTVNDLTAAISEQRRYLLDEIEGVESNVALVSSNELALMVNSKSDGAAISDAPTMIMSGLIGALLHPDPREILVIGLGTGSSAGWFAGIETAETVEVIELEPAVIAFLSAFGPVNLDAHTSEKIELVAGDGREHVLTSSSAYDLIFSEPSNPYRAGVADLFSRDFYLGVEKRLAPDGIFLQWLQLYEVDAKVLQTALATITSVFPSVETWMVNSGDLLLVASRQPLHHDPAELRRRVAMEPYRSALSETWGVEGLEGLYSGYVAGPELAAGLGRGGDQTISTDDRPLIEFGFVRNLGSPKGIARDLLASAHQRRLTRPPVPPGTLSWERVEELRDIRALERTYPATFQPPAGSPRAARFAARSAWVAGQVERAAALWAAQDGAPMAPLDRLLVAEGAAFAGAPKAEAVLADLSSTRPAEAAMPARPMAGGARPVRRRGRRPEHRLRHHARACLVRLGGRHPLVRADQAARRHQPAARTPPLRAARIPLRGLHLRAAPSPAPGRAGLDHPGPHAVRRGPRRLRAPRRVAGGVLARAPALLPGQRSSSRRACRGRSRPLPGARGTEPRLCGRRRGAATHPALTRASERAPPPERWWVGFGTRTDDARCGAWPHEPTAMRHSCPCRRSV